MVLSSPAGSSFRDVQLAWRQWRRFDKRLRIGPASATICDAALPVLEKLRADIEQLAQAQEPAATTRPGAEPSGSDPSLVRTLVTTFWKVETQASKLSDSVEGRTLRSRLRQLSHVLKNHDIQVYDYSGQTYDPDEIWDEVVSDETRKTDPIITEMREPRIIYRGNILQRGTPIVEDRAKGEDE